LKFAPCSKRPREGSCDCDQKREKLRDAVAKYLASWQTAQICASRSRTLTKFGLHQNLGHYHRYGRFFPQLDDFRCQSSGLFPINSAWNMQHCPYNSDCKLRFLGAASLAALPLNVGLEPAPLKFRRRVLLHACSREL